MIWHFHDFGKWEDVNLGDKATPARGVSAFIVMRQVITQQRRCAVCNLVQTRYSG